MLDTFQVLCSPLVVLAAAWSKLWAAGFVAMLVIGPKWRRRER